jgi:hypothetical protein
MVPRLAAPPGYRGAFSTTEEAERVFDALREEKIALDDATRKGHATLFAIIEGEMLAALPDGKEDAKRHNAACWMLEGLFDNISATLRKIDGEAE